MFLTVDTSIVIHAAPEAVWDYACKPENWTASNPTEHFGLRFDSPDNLPHAGTAFVQKESVAGQVAVLALSVQSSARWASRPTSGRVSAGTPPTTRSTQACTRPRCFAAKSDAWIALRGASVPLAITGADSPGSPRALSWLSFGPPAIGIFKDGFED